MSSLAALAPVDMQRLSPFFLDSAFQLAKNARDQLFPACLEDSQIFFLLGEVMKSL